MLSTEETLIKLIDEDLYQRQWLRTRGIKCKLMVINVSRTHLRGQLDIVGGRGQVTCRTNPRAVGDSFSIKLSNCFHLLRGPKSKLYRCGPILHANRLILGPRLIDKSQQIDPQVQKLA